MNLNERTKLQEDSAEREEAIYHLATRLGQQDEEKSPITLELTNPATGHFRISGFDAFKLETQEVTDGGRHREQRTLSIEDNHMTFVTHQSYTGLMKVIPATEHNLKLLASHYSGNRWFIHEEKWREKVAEMAASIKPTRDEKTEMQEPEFMPHVAAKTEEDAKKRLEELDRQIREKEMLLQQKNIEMKPKEPEPVSVVNMSITPDDDTLEGDDGEPEFEDEDAPPEPKPLGEISEALKQRVREKHAEEIMQLRERGIKRLEMTREWKRWMKEELQTESV